MRSITFAAQCMLLLLPLEAAASFSLLTARSERGRFITRSKLLPSSTLSCQKQQRLTSEQRLPNSSALRQNVSSNNSMNQNEKTSILDTLLVPKQTATARSVAVAALTNKQQSNQRGQLAVQRLEFGVQVLVDQRDRSFARNIVATVERRMGQIDKVLRLCAHHSYPPKRARGKHSKLLQASLRVGAAQLLFLATPHHAAVKETVDVLLMQSPPVPSPLVKFVNAVLRKVAREGPHLLQLHTSAKDNIAPWLVQEWVQCWGEDNAIKIINQVLREPHIDITVSLPVHLSAEERALELEALRLNFGEDAIVLPTNGSIRINTKNGGGVISNWPLYNEGRWWVQDVSSTLPAMALQKGLQRNCDITKLHVVDMCAAPGGKTAQLLTAGFRKVTAVELIERRSRRLIENLNRLRLRDKCEVVIADGQTWIPGCCERGNDDLEDDDNSFNKQDEIAGILVDVPCSATGTGSRRPDVFQRDSSLGNLLETQRTLVNHCADNLLPVGGILVYATCSLLKRESEDQIRSLIARGGEGKKAVMKTMAFSKGEIPGFDDAIDKHGWLRVLPGVLKGDLESCDGFFVARLVKVG